MGTNNKQITALRINRIAAGLRLADVAREINRSIMFVQRLETGGSARLTPEIASKIAEALSTSPENLFRDGDDK
jgi:transcriptional regulator with XRE-family HTH domain